MRVVILLYKFLTVVCDIGTYYLYGLWYIRRINCIKLISSGIFIKFDIRDFC